MNQTTSTTHGVHHVGLNVPDLVAARHFFVDGLGFEQVGEKPEYPAVFVSDGQVMITLWQAQDPDRATPFDRKRNIGLHHLALRVQPNFGLDELHGRLSARDDVEIEFAPESLGRSATQHMMCRIPGNIRVEFIAPAS